MRTLLFAPITFNLAEVTRMIVVAQAMGPDWNCVFQAYEDEFTNLVREAGFEVRQLAPVFTPEETKQAMAFDQGSSVKHPFSPELVSSRVAAERDLIRELDAVGVVMGTNVTSLISARAEHVPLFYAVPFALTKPHVNQTKYLGLKPGNRFIDRVASTLFRLAYNKLPVVPKAFKQVANANGVRPLRHIVDLVTGDHNLLTVMASELRGYTLPDGYVRVGPIFAQLPGEVPDDVLALAAEPRPLVYLALGSSGSRELVLKSARALGALDVNVVAPIGHYLEPGDAEQLPDNIHVVDLLPAHKLGGIVDAAVIHGGQGTVQTACATGVPFVGMGLQPEQTWNVTVAEGEGNAIALTPSDVGKQAFLDAVHRVLTDPGIRAAADRVQRKYAAEDGGAAAAQEIKRVLAA